MIITSCLTDWSGTERGLCLLMSAIKITCGSCNQQFSTTAISGFVRCSNCRYLVLVSAGNRTEANSLPRTVTSKSGPASGSRPWFAGIEGAIESVKSFFAGLGQSNRIGDGTGSRPNRSASSPKDFELLCAEWMVWFGMTNVRLTPVTGDGGVDVLADGVVAQSKFYSKNSIGEPAIRDLLGARTHAGVPLALFFCTGGGYTATAIKFSSQNGVELFHFNERHQRFEGVTQAAKAMCRGM